MLENLVVSLSKEILSTVSRAPGVAPLLRLTPLAPLLNERTSQQDSTPGSLRPRSGVRSRRSLMLEVVEVQSLTPDAVAITFSEESGAGIRHRPGQHLTLELPVPDQTIERCYSICGSAKQSGRVTIGVKRVPGGPGSNWLIDEARPGLRLKAHPPSGAFVPRDPDDAFMLIAAGSGITPILAIARWVIEAGSGTVEVLYANRDRASVMFERELAELAQEHPTRFRIRHWYDDDAGHMTGDALTAVLVDQGQEVEIFACGPPAFLDLLTEATAIAGLPPGRVKQERFSFEVSDAATPSDDEGVSVDAQVALTVRGDRSSLDWPAGTVLLDRMIDADIEVPYVCRAGFCGGCVFTLEDGDVRMRENHVLDDADLAEGRRLACQSLATSDAVVATFVD